MEWAGLHRYPGEAARAYDAGARELLGPKAETNFPPEEEKKHDDEGTAAAAGGSSHKGGGGGDAVYNAPSGSATTDSSPKMEEFWYPGQDPFLLPRTGFARDSVQVSQAYTLELEAEIDKLNKEVNQRLKKEQEEIDKAYTLYLEAEIDKLKQVNQPLKKQREIIEAQSNKSVKERMLRYARRGHADGDDDFQKIKEPKMFGAHRRAQIKEFVELVESREDLISQNLHQLNLGEISRQRKLDGLSEDNNMVEQEAGSASSRNQTTSSRNRTGFGLNRLLFGITKKGRSIWERMVLDETGNKSESVQTVDKWTEGASSSLNPWDNSSSCMSENNITGTSPEKERFEDELKEAHSLLRMDDDLVLFMDRKPFCLHILDLSGTSISNLPKCISELVTLESLTLRDCILLMELPPEIGELTNLKLLDLLGTEVVCLPKEIAKLVSLRSFRIALCGYADHFKESRGIDSVIPRNALSKLSNLSDFRIHVNPDGDWWDVEVKAVIEDLRDLGNLRTLHLDLPKVDLLDDLMRSINQLLHLSSLCFRLTVGPHEERIIHRLPQHAEKEFHDLERFEKGVKYTNSEGIPVEIKNALKYADAFLLERHWSVKNLLEFGVENMNELKCCILLECNELQTVIDAEKCKDFNGSILGSLECLSIHYMKKMERIWKGQVMKGSLSNMKSLALHTCVSLTTVFTLDLLANLMNLEELIIEDCPNIKTLVSSNPPNLIPQNFLPKLKTMLLLELPNLGCISSGLTIAPKLERLVIFYCPKLDKLSPVEISSRVLKVIKGEKRWWDALNWYESGATEEKQEYLAGKFVPLRKDEDLEEQFMRD